MQKFEKSHVAILVTAILILSVGSFATKPTQALSANPATITLLPPAGPVGMPITVRGTNFEPGAKVDLSWFGYIVEIPGVKGHLGYYPIKTDITVSAGGSFVTTIVAPYDFGPDVPHYVNATQNGVGTGIMNATFTIAPSIRLSPQPANYTEGQEVFLYVYGAPLGTPALMMGLTQRLTVLKLTYDNTVWGFATSHLETEGPIVTAGFVGGDVGGNATIRFKAVGGVGVHSIRGYVGEKDAPPYLPCEIGGEGEFYILGPSLDTRTVLNRLTSTNSTIASVGGGIDAIKTGVSTIDGKVTNIGTGVTTIQTDLGTVRGSTDSTVNYGLGALALSVINLIVLLVVAARVYRKP